MDATLTTAAVGDWSEMDPNPTPSAPLTCEAVLGDLMSLLDGALTALAVEQVHAHFLRCSTCARFYEALRAQLVLHQWGVDARFDLEAVDACLPADVPDYPRLAARIRAADLGQLGRLLYEILKAEFLADFGDGLEPAEAPIEDPKAERARGAGIVEELRVWHDRDDVDGVDLGDLAAKLRRGDDASARLGALIGGMQVVAQLQPDLQHAAAHYEAMAHLKAGRRTVAERLLRGVVSDGPPALQRFAEICLATIPIMQGTSSGDAIEQLRQCLRGDALDLIVEFNLAKAHIIAAGGALTDAGRQHLERARRADPEFVTRQVLLDPTLRAALGS